MKQPESTYYALLYIETQLEGIINLLKMQNYDFAEDLICSVSRTASIQAENFRKWLEKTYQQ